MVMYRTPVNKMECKGYSPSRESLVETAGYRSTKQMVEEFMHAGRLLSAARSEFYDYPDGNVPDGDIPDPTRSGNFDRVDAQRLGDSAMRRLVSQKKAAELDKKISTDVQQKSVEGHDEKK